MVEKATPVIIIPVYQASQPLQTLVEGLVAHELPVLIIDDGSSQPSQIYFDAVKALPNVEVVHHTENEGKGEALKTGMRHFLQAYPANLPGVITVDADGQHSLDDIIALTKKFQESPQDFILGVRNFEAADIPWRSKIGNLCTKYLFRALSKKNLTDTQTGLRAIPRQLLPEFLDLQCKKYDFELEMLLYVCAEKITIQQFPIRTIYHEKNESSHFRAVVDSMKIYYVMMRFSAIAIFSFGLDYFLFAVTYLLSNHFIVAIVFARAISSLFNYNLNKQITFQHGGPVKNTLAKYYLLCAFALFFSVLLLLFFKHIHVNIFLAKIVVDFIIFILNFTFQKLLVFRNGRSGRNSRNSKAGKCSE